ncbi:MAG: extracellular solute-binding protein [Chloroflexota bacterium]|jgi:multiple sugar transport system substrate-binding protein|nr:extracellular solute-binding protein [Chloroflexota bacterium]
MASSFDANVFRRRVNRRSALKGAGAAAALSAWGLRSSGSKRAFAQDSVKDQILAIPGPGQGSPSESDIERVGELVLNTDKQGAFEGQTVVFQGLSNAGFHVNVFRPLARAWEEATGARVEWIEVTQADSYPRMSQGLASGNVEFDVLEGSGGWEGEMLGGGYMVPMPDSILNAPEFAYDDIVAYLRDPIRTWDGVTYGASVDGDMHHFNYRTDVFGSEDLAEEWASSDGEGEFGVPQTWQQVQAYSQFFEGKSDPDGLPLYGILDPLARSGGVGTYFYFSRASAYAKHPDDPAFFFDPETMIPKINSPAFVRALQDMIDAIPAAPPDQQNADLLKTLGDFLAGTGSMAHWWADIGANVYASDQSIVQNKVGFSILPGSPDVYNYQTGEWDLIEGNNYAPYLAFLGWGLYVTKASEERGVSEAAWDLVKHLSSRDVSLWMNIYPSGMNPSRESHFDAADWTIAGYPEADAQAYLDSISGSYNHPNRIVDLRIPGQGEYWIAAEDEWTRAVSGELEPQEALDNAAAAWDEITDRYGRETQRQLYTDSLG